MFSVDVIALNRLENRFPPFGLDLPAGACCAVIVCRHLRKDSITQTEWGIAEAFEPQTFQQFVIDRRPGHDDLGASGSDTLNFSPLRDRQPSQALCDPAHLYPRHDVPLPAIPAMQVTGNRCQRCRRARRSDYVAYLSSANAIHNPIDFARHETAKALQLSLAWRIVTQELIRQPHGPEREADSVADASAVRNG